MAKNRKASKMKAEVRFVVTRKFSGNRTMKEVFEQVIEQQTCGHFEEWRERRAD